MTSAGRKMYHMASWDQAMHAPVAARGVLVTSHMYVLDPDNLDWIQLPSSVMWIHPTWTSREMYYSYLGWDTWWYRCHGGQKHYALSGLPRSEPMLELDEVKDSVSGSTCMLQHTETWTKWFIFCTWYCQMSFFPINFLQFWWKFHLNTYTFLKVYILGNGWGEAGLTQTYGAMLRYLTTTMMAF